MLSINTLGFEADDQKAMAKCLLDDCSSFMLSLCSRKSVISVLKQCKRLQSLKLCWMGDDEWWEILPNILHHGPQLRKIDYLDEEICGGDFNDLDQSNELEFTRCHLSSQCFMVNKTRSG